MSEAGLDPGALMPKLSPVLTLDPKRCCEDGEDRMQNRPVWGWGRKLRCPVTSNTARGYLEVQANFLRLCVGWGGRWGPERLSNVSKVTFPVMPSWDTTNVS